MVNTKSTGNGKKNNKTKLISSIAMLLVATIMVVTSTYAWVVLSTAPEVTEITTTVGANGALEIKLNIPDDASDKNSVFRNIVEFTNSKYGLDKITLLPSMPSDDFANNYLLIPEYGYDGLITGNGAGSYVGSLEDDGKFYQNDGTGVRVVGTATGTSPRQSAFDSAVRAAKSAMSGAKNAAKSSLNNDRFQSIVIKMVTNAGASYATEDVDALGTMINGLVNSVTKLEEAYKQLIFASAASDNGQDDVVASLVQDLWGSEGLTLDAIATSGKIVAGEYSVDVESTVLAGIRALQSTKANVAAAKDAYDNLDRADDTFESSEITPILNALVNKDKILVNGSDPSSVDFAEVLANGATVTMQDGAGVYVEIADQVGDYSVAISSNVTMETETALTDAYLVYSLAEVEGVGAPGTDTSALPMDVHVGYIVDLVFKTNAKTSNLLLQTEGIDRIDNNNPSESTMGGGSYMEFSLVEGADITNTQVIQIMSCFRIVFFDTDTKAILGTAKLDTANATVGANQAVKAMMSMEDGDNVITALGQNTEEKVSVLVYLDAENLENEHVSATTAQSITGVMNLQFASDADLVPMPYGNN